MNRNDELAPQLLRELERLQHPPARNPQRAARTRAAFLAEAGLLSQAAPMVRSKYSDWWNSFLSPRPLKFALVTLIVICAILGSGAATVAAAQTNLPNQALYPIKTWSEDLRLNLASNPDTRLALELEFTDRRITEVREMFGADSVPPETALLRLENQVESSLQIAVNYPDAEAAAALVQISLQLRSHRERLAQQQLQTASPQVNNIRARVQEILSTNLLLAEAGATEPSWLRKQLKLRRQQNQPGPFPTATAISPTGVNTLSPNMSSTPGNTKSPEGTPNPTQGNGNSFGPGQPGGPSAIVTPTPGNGYGPGEPHHTPSSPGKTSTPKGPGKPQKTPGSGGPGNGK